MPWRLSDAVVAQELSLAFGQIRFPSTRGAIFAWTGLGLDEP
jgi:hypothetical protein